MGHRNKFVRNYLHNYIQPFPNITVFDYQWLPSVLKGNRKFFLLQLIPICVRSKILLICTGLVSGDFK